jgi:hypothetical protein
MDVLRSAPRVWAASPKPAAPASMALANVRRSHLWFWWFVFKVMLQVGIVRLLLYACKRRELQEWAQ